MKGQAAWGKLLLQLHSLVHSTRLQLVSVHFCVSEDGRREKTGRDGEVRGLGIVAYGSAAGSWHITTPVMIMT